MIKFPVKLLTTNSNTQYDTTPDCLNKIAQDNAGKEFPLTIVDNKQAVEINFAKIINLRVEDNALLGDMIIYVYPAIVGQPKNILATPDGDKDVVTEYDLKKIVLINRS